MDRNDGWMEEAASEENARGSPETEELWETDAEEATTTTAAEAESTQQSTVNRATVEEEQVTPAVLQQNGQNGQVVDAVATGSTTSAITVVNDVSLLENNVDLQNAFKRHHRRRRRRHHSERSCSDNSWWWPLEDIEFDLNHGPGVNSFFVNDAVTLYTDDDATGFAALEVPRAPITDLDDPSPINNPDETDHQHDQVTVVPKESPLLASLDSVVNENKYNSKISDDDKEVEQILQKEVELQTQPQAAIKIANPHAANNNNKSPTINTDIYQNQHNKPEAVGGAEQTLEEFREELRIKRLARHTAVQNLRDEIITLRQQLAAEQRLTRRLRSGEPVEEVVEGEDQLSSAVDKMPTPTPTPTTGEADADADDVDPISRGRHANIELADAQLALQLANSENLSLRTELGVVQKQVGTLKEVIACCKQMLAVKEEQCTQLKSKLTEIETSFGERELKIMSDNLRQEYEQQLANIRQLKQLYEERQRIAAAEQENLQRLLTIKRDELEAAQEKTKTSEERIQALMAEIESLNNDLSKLNEECNEHKYEKRALKEEMFAVNTLFSQWFMGFNGKDNVDIDKLTDLLEENRTLLNEMMADEEGDVTDTAVLPKLLFELVELSTGSNKKLDAATPSPIKEIKPDFEGKTQENIAAAAAAAATNTDVNIKSTVEADEPLPLLAAMKPEQEVIVNTVLVDNFCNDSNLKHCKVASAQEIIRYMPKVWKILTELLRTTKYEPRVPQPISGSSDDCYKSVETANGPKPELSISKTYIKLKDLILEKRALNKETNRLKMLNRRLNRHLNETEKRLSEVSLEVTKTWHLVGKMQRQHRQLRTKEQILRYQLQQKRRLLGELREELDYCRRKWEQARIKNEESQEQCDELRREFAYRKLIDANNSAESGYSDSGPPSDEEERAAEVAEAAAAAAVAVANVAGRTSARRRCYKESLVHTRKVKRMQSTSPGRTETGMVLLRWNSAPAIFFNADDDDSEEATGVDSDELDILMPLPNTGAIPKIGAHRSRSRQRRDKLVFDDMDSLIRSIEAAERAEEMDGKENQGVRANRIQRLEEQCKTLIIKVLETSGNREKLEIQLCKFQEEISPVQYAVPLEEYIKKRRTERNTRARSAPATGTLTPREEEYTRKRSERLERLEEESRELLSRLNRTNDRGQFLCCSLDRIRRAPSREDSFESNTEEEVSKTEKGGGAIKKGIAAATKPVLTDNEVSSDRDDLDADDENGSDAPNMQPNIVQEKVKEPTVAPGNPAHPCVKEVVKETSSTSTSTNQVATRKVTEGVLKFQSGESSEADDEASEKQPVFENPSISKKQLNSNTQTISAHKADSENQHITEGQSVPDNQSEPENQSAAEVSSKIAITYGPVIGNSFENITFGAVAETFNAVAMATVNPLGEATKNITPGTSTPVTSKYNTENIPETALDEALESKSNEASVMVADINGGNLSIDQISKNAIENFSPTSLANNSSVDSNKQSATEILEQVLEMEASTQVATGESQTKTADSSKVEVGVQDAEHVSVKDSENGMLEDFAESEGKTTEATETRPPTLAALAAAVCTSNSIAFGTTAQNDASAIVALECAPDEAAGGTTTGLTAIGTATTAQSYMEDVACLEQDIMSFLDKVSASLKNAQQKAVQKQMATPPAAEDDDSRFLTPAEREYMARRTERLLRLEKESKDLYRELAKHTLPIEKKLETLKPLGNEPINVRLKELERRSNEREERLNNIEASTRQLLTRINTSNERNSGLTERMLTRERRLERRRQRTEEAELARMQVEEVPLSASEMMPTPNNVVCSSIVGEAEDASQRATISATTSQIAIQQQGRVNAAKSGSQLGAIPKTKPQAKLCAAKRQNTKKVPAPKQNDDDEESLEMLVKRLRAIHAKQEEDKQIEQTDDEQKQEKELNGQEKKNMQEHMENQDEQEEGEEKVD